MSHDQILLKNTSFSFENIRGFSIIKKYILLRISKTNRNNNILKYRIKLTRFLCNACGC